MQFLLKQTKNEQNLDIIANKENVREQLSIYCAGLLLLSKKNIA